MSKEDAEVLVGRKRDSDLCGFEGAKPEAVRALRGSQEADEWPIWLETKGGSERVWALPNFR